MQTHLISVVKYSCSRLYMPVLDSSVYGFVLFLGWVFLGGLYWFYFPFSDMFEVY